MRPEGRRVEGRQVGEPVSKTRLRLWLKLLKLTSGIEAELRRRLRHGHGTTLPRFDVMAALSRHPEGLKMGDLSGYLRVSNGNVTGIVGRLAEEGLVSRVAVPGDRRAQIARLTCEGKATFDALAERHEGWVDRSLARLGAEDAAKLAALLDKALGEGNGNV